MKMTLKISLLAALALTLAACASTAVQLSSLRDTSVLTMDSAPTEKPYLGIKPGAQPLISRTFGEQPPLVPHKVDGFDEINATDNACLDCHIHENFRGQVIPRAGASHFVKQSDASVALTLDMKRWQCNSCHVPQVDAKPLVGNVFQGNLVR